MEEANQPKQLTKKERRELKRQQKKEAQRKREQLKRFKRIGVWLAAILGIVGIIFAFKPGGGSSSQPTLSVNTVASSDQTKGNKEAKLILIEYSDFQCPACGRYYFLLKQLNQEYGDQIQFVYRHFPLKRIHLYAQLAAQATEAAGKQGKFWEMHDLIFENQKEWSEQKNAKKTLIEYAKSLNLDVDKFKSDLGSKEVKNKVQADYQSGVKAGVDSTPTLFLNGKKLPNPKSYSELKNIIQQAISNE
jgi:protein-disulfide isomerase